MRWLLKGRIKLCRGHPGFTLIEVLIAMGILAAVGTAFLVALNTNSRVTHSLDEKVTATNLTTAYIEAIKEVSYAVTYPSAGDNIAVPPQYDVDVDIKYSSDGGTTWLDTYTDEHFQKITITISREGRYILSVCTFRSER